MRISAGAQTIEWLLRNGYEDYAEDGKAIVK